MGDPVSVGVAELKVSDNSAMLVSFGLGSCVAVAMFDPLKKVGGLAHVMLPESRGRNSEGSPGKFADTAVARLVDELIELGARRGGIRCKIVGGSQMFEIPGARREGCLSGDGVFLNIGAQNVEVVKRSLEELGIPLVGEDTGGSYGRTVKFDTSTGEVEVSSIQHGRKLF